MAEENDKLEDFKIDIREDADNSSEQRSWANRDMRFVNVTGGQWEDFYNEVFNDDRTKLELDLTSNTLHRFVGEWNQNRVGVDFKPDDKRTRDSDADIINGIYRADYRQYSGKISVGNAVLEAATCGVGAFKLSTVFEDESDPENELQRIIWKPITSAFNRVFWDSSSHRLDKKDAQYCTELFPVTEKMFEQNWPGITPSSAYKPEDLQEFNFLNGLKTHFLIAKRYEIEKKREKIFVYGNADDEIIWYSENDHKKIEDELREDPTKQFIRERSIVRQYCNVTAFSGDRILEKTRRIAGKWIPIIPVYAYWGFSDGIEWYRGIVRSMVDAQRLYNMQVSQIAENSASLGQEVPIVDPEQVDGFEDEWRNRTNASLLRLNALRDESGNIVSAGPLSYLKPAQLDGSTQALLQLVPDYINRVGGASLQDTLDPNASGKAINALIKRENLNTQIITDNIETAIVRSGEVYKDMVPDIYNTPRMIRLIGLDGVEQEERLFKVTVDEQTGKTVEANTLHDKKFRVFSDIGPQYEALREQTVEDVKGALEIISDSGSPQIQEYVPVLIATMFENMSGVGVGPIRDFNRKKMLMMGLVKPANEEEEQFLQSLQQQPEDDSQRKLIEALTKQADLEGDESKAKIIDLLASAEKKAAEAEEIRAETEAKPIDKLKSLQEIRSSILGEAKNI